MSIIIADRFESLGGNTPFIPFNKVGTPFTSDNLDSVLREVGVIQDQLLPLLNVTPTKVYPSIKDMIDDTTTRVNGTVVEVTGFYANFISIIPGVTGGGKFVYVSSAAKSLHDVGEYISPTVPWDGTATSIANWFSKTGETSVGGSGCWRRVLQDPLTVSITHCGAHPTLADNTAQINQAFSILRNSALNTQGGYQGIYRKSKVEFTVGGNYICLGSLNATGMLGTGWVIEGNGCNIWSKASGKAALDLLQSARYTIRDLTITGDSTLPPKWGLGIGRTSGNTAGKFQLYNVVTEGYFTRSAAYNFAAEVCGFYQCRFTNSRANAYCLIQDSSNTESYASDFVAQTLPANTVASFNENIFIGCEFRQLGNGVAIRFAGSEHSRHRFENCYGRTDNNYLMETYATTLFRNMYLDIHGEASTLTKLLVIDNVNTPGTVTLQGLTIIDHYPFCTNSIVDLAGTTNTVVLDDFHLKVVDTVTGCVVFGNTAGAASKLLVDGEIHWPNSRTLDISNCQFSGDIFTKAGTTINHSAEGAYRIVKRPDSTPGAKTNFFKGEVRSVSGGTATTTENNYSEMFGSGTNTIVGLRVGSDVNSDVSVGLFSKGNGSVILGSSGSVAPGIRSSIGGGLSQIANADYSSISGGSNNSITSASTGAFIPGGRYGLVSNRMNGWAIGTGNTSIGRHQSAGMALAGFITNTTASIDLTSDGTTVASTSNQFILRANSAAMVRAEIIARDTVTGDCKSWTVKFMVKCGATASTLALGGLVIEEIYSDTAAAGWVASVIADTTYGAPRFRFNTGAAVANLIRVTVSLVAAEVA